HAINIGGGFHHAKRSRAEGFCVFNDVAIIAKIAEKKYRTAIVDIDGHHGDGTEELLKNDNILKVSLHMFHRGFFPGTGNLEDNDEKTVNIPLPPGTADDAYLLAFNEIAMPILEEYRPELLIIMEGGDSHFDDPLVELKLSTHGYLNVIKELHSLSHKVSGKIILLGGGGYNYDATARTWVISIAELTGIQSIEVDTLHDCCNTVSSPFVMEKVKDTIQKIKQVRKNLAH
ncbi:acetoin utilization protein AcuC, partial [Acidianus sp. DSM 29099]|nr:acetoin utilization protein AcuC [Acidianus sp. RZ1]